MYKKLILLIALTVLPATAHSETYWGGELPYVKDTAVEAEVTLDGDIYSYSYSVHSSSANTGEIWSIDVDIKQPQGGMKLSDAGIVSGLGFARHSAAYVLSDPSTPKMVPVGMFSPIDWNSGLSDSGMAGWASNTAGDRILPGQSLIGFKMTSHGLPGIREFKVDPKLMPPQVGTVTLDEMQVVEDRASYFAKTIGPTAPPKALSAMFEIIGGHITESLKLGWLSDSALADNLRVKLTAAKQFVDANDGPQAKTELGEFMTLLENSSASQRTNEGYGLLFYNAKYLKDNLR